MKVFAVNWDEWVDVFSHDHEQPCHSLRDAMDAVSRLNGEQHTLVELLVTNRRYLTIGGGPQFYVCFATTKEGQFSLEDPSVTEGERVLVVGGQQGVYPKERCLTRALTDAAVGYYVVHGELDPELTWRRV